MENVYTVVFWDALYNGQYVREFRVVDDYHFEKSDRALLPYQSFNTLAEAEVCLAEVEEKFSWQR